MPAHYTKLWILNFKSKNLHHFLSFLALSNNPHFLSFRVTLLSHIVQSCVTKKPIHQFHPCFCLKSVLLFGWFYSVQNFDLRWSVGCRKSCRNNNEFMKLKARKVIKFPWVTHFITIPMSKLLCDVMSIEMCVLWFVATHLNFRLSKDPLRPDTVITSQVITPRSIHHFISYPTVTS